MLRKRLFVSSPREPNLPMLSLPRFHRFPVLVMAASALLLFVGSVEAFCIRTKTSAVLVDTTTARNQNPCVLARRPLVVLHESSSNNNDNSNKNSDESPILSSASPNSAMSETSRLSHAQLKVPSVDDSVEFWISKGGRLVRSRSNGKTNGEAKLLSAFVQLGPVGSQTDGEDFESFSLEFVEGTPPKKNNKKHGISYLGLSMLLRFRDKNPLLELMTGTSNEKDSTTTKGEEDEDNNKSNAMETEDFPVKYVASAPGDGLAQLALLSDNKLVETCDFYTRVLGMDQKAQDQKLLCLRYDCEDPSNTNGVATTLVFENQPVGPETLEEEEECHHGCFDHLAINTTSSIEGLYQSILEENKREENPVKVYMKPTSMFGNHVLGLIDPNGYKVVVFGSN